MKITIRCLEPIFLVFIYKKSVQAVFYFVSVAEKKLLLLLLLLLLSYRLIESVFPVILSTEQVIKSVSLYLLKSQI